MIVCKYCGTTVTRSNRGQTTCGSAECKTKRKTDYKREWLARPKSRVTARKRNAAWCAEHRNVRNRNPWLSGAPPYDPHLPGGACVITIPRMRQIPMHRLSQLHGMATALLDERHGQDPGFTLIPWPGGIGWALYCPTGALAAPPRARAARLGDVAVQVQLGPYARIKTPLPGKRGHQRVRVSTLTPVVITTMNRTVAHRSPTVETLQHSLTKTLARRLGLELTVEDVPLQIVDATTEPSEIDVGGHVRWLRGWMGTIVVETNAVGRWLLECAGRGVGLGGRTAFGCGRVRVEAL